MRKITLIYQKQLGSTALKFYSGLAAAVILKLLINLFDTISLFPSLFWSMINKLRTLTELACFA